MRTIVLSWLNSVRATIAAPARLAGRGAMQGGLALAAGTALAAAGASSANPPPPASTHECVCEALRLRLSQGPANQHWHWGDIVVGQNPPTGFDLTTGFPPPNGVNPPNFRSVAGWPFIGNRGIVPQATDIRSVGIRLFEYPPGVQQPTNIVTGDFQIHPSADAPDAPTNQQPLWFPAYPLNKDMRFGPAAGDYPPRKLALAESSSPIVTRLGAPFFGPAPLAERPTVEDEVDLITGQVLLQETDFELPFGQATFRWIRTYSEHHEHFSHELEGHSYSSDPDGDHAEIGGTPGDGTDALSPHPGRDFSPQQMYWDWAGQGWMLGVQPLLLIDYSAWDWNNGDNQLDTRCYFLPDAHHAVPFNLLPQSQGNNTRRYEAPPRFGMTLSHNGSGSPSAWSSWPTEWYVWMHQRSVRYVFKPVYSDVPPEFIVPGGPPYLLATGDSEHATPNGAPTSVDFRHMFNGQGRSRGMPHYAVLTAIDDLHGNRIQIEYAPARRELWGAMNNVSLTPQGCYEFLHRTQAKGQMRRITLWTGVKPAEANPYFTATRAWTIVPVYRTFGGSTYRRYSLQGPTNPLNFSVGRGLWVLEQPRQTAVGQQSHPVSGATAERWENQYAIDSIYVFRGAEPAEIAGQTQFTIADTTFVQQQLPERPTQGPDPHPDARRWTALKTQVAAALAAVPSPLKNANWAQRIRYTYADETRTWGDVEADARLVAGGDELKVFATAPSVLEPSPTAPGGTGRPKHDGLEKRPPLQSPRLVLVQRELKPTGGDPAPEPSVTMYRYAAIDNAFGGPRSLDPWKLVGVWTPRTMQEIRRRIAGPRAGSPWEDGTRQIFAANWPYSALFLRDFISGTSEPAKIVPGVGGNPGEPARPLVRWADRRYLPWTAPEAGAPGSRPYTEGGDDFFNSSFRVEMVQKHIQPYIGGLPTPTLIVDPFGVAVRTTRDRDGRERVHRMYRNLVAPSDWAQSASVSTPTSPLDWLLGDSIGLTRSAVHAPYSLTAQDAMRLPLVANPGPANQSEQGLQLARSLGNRMWVVVVDTYDTFDEAAITGSESFAVSIHGQQGGVSMLDRYRAVGSDPSEWAFLPTKRQLFVMNPAGYVLHKRQWIFRGPEAGQNQAEGLVEEHIYDWNLAEEYPTELPTYQTLFGTSPQDDKALIGRLIEKRSYGWFAAAYDVGGGPVAGNQNSMGLITRYAYDPGPSGAGDEFKRSMHPAAVGVKKGKNGAIRWQTIAVRDAKRTELMREELSFPEPTYHTLPWGIPFATFRDGNLPEGVTDDQVNRTSRRYQLERVSMSAAPGEEHESTKVRIEATIKPWNTYAFSADTPVFPAEIRQWGNVGGWDDQWRAYGLLSEQSKNALRDHPALGVTQPPTDPDLNWTPGNHQQTTWFVDFQRSNSQGAVVLAIADAGPSGTGNGPVPSPPVSWSLNQWSDWMNAADLTGVVNPSNGSPTAPIVPDWAVRKATIPPQHDWVFTKYTSADSSGTPYPERIQFRNGTGKYFNYASRPIPGETGPNPPFCFHTRTFHEVDFHIEEVPSGQGSGYKEYPIHVYAPGQLDLFEQIVDDGRAYRGNLFRSMRVGWSLGGSPHAVINNWGNAANLGYTLVRELDIQRNSDGMPTKMSLKATGINEVRKVEIAYTNLGEIMRELHPNSTIVRNVYDPRGRLLRVYRGTRDSHPYWGLAPGDSGSDNLVITERRDYGYSAHDANQVIRVWSFRDKPANQYPTNGQPAGETAAGWFTQFTHDWRMRPVVQSVYKVNTPPSETPGAPPLPPSGQPHGSVEPVTPLPPDAMNLRHTVTYRDHLDRPRFVAVYRGVKPATATVDPVMFAPDKQTPSASAILGVTPRPLQLTETVYNGRGLAEESREYDVTVTDGSAYHTTFTWYDHEDRPVRVIRPNGHDERSVYNTRGQLVRQTMHAGSVQLSSTEYTYDQVGNTIETRTIERVKNDSNAALDVTGTDANAVVRATWNWYDDERRLIATADLGTGSEGAPASSAVKGFYANRRDAGGEPAFPNRLAAAAPAITYGAKPSDWPFALNPVASVSRAGAPAWARLTCYAYDPQGQQALVVRPDGTTTHTLYNNFGEVILTAENSSDTDANVPRTVTANYYDDFGRLQHIVAILNGFTRPSPADLATAGPRQVTTLVYGADLVDSGGVVIPGIVTGTADPINAQNPALVKEVLFPAPNSGLASTNHKLTFRYFNTGEIAERVDANGHVLAYRLNELGEHTQTLINPFGGTPPPNYPLIENLVRLVDMSYDQLGRLTKVTARGPPPAGGGDPAIIADNRFEYDTRGQLLTEFQQHGLEVNTGTSPRVDYEWQWAGFSSEQVKLAPVGGFTYHNGVRLTSITYPDRHPGAPEHRRRIRFDYSGSPVAGIDVDHVASRISAVRQISSWIGAPDPGGYLAAFKHSGSSRRIATELFDPAAMLELAVRTSHENPDGGTLPDVGLFGLDSFGQIKNLHHTRPGTGSPPAPPLTLQQFQYAHDSLGQRTTVVATHGVPLYPSQFEHNTRSFVYRYDKLGRLVGSDLGRITFTGGQFSQSIEPNNPLPRRSTWNLDWLGNWAGASMSAPGLLVTDNVLLDGQPRTLRLNHTVGRNNTILDQHRQLDGVGLPVTFVYDRAGNLIADELCYYQYDPFGRLVQVYLRGTATFDDPAGIRGGVTGGALGSLVIHYAYDGLGRLISAQRPWPGQPADRRIERYYYDGLRRIQELFQDPAQDFNPGTDGIGLDDAAGGGLGQAARSYTDREHVWTPGGGLFEHLAQVVPAASTSNALGSHGEGWWLSLLDASGTVTGVADAAGAIRETLTYDPYGQVLVRSSSPYTPRNRVGHQGLFFDKLDAPGDPAGSPQLVPHARGVYQNVNRSYAPQHGRFLQRDPNASGQPLALAMAMHGSGHPWGFGHLNALGMYGDGMSLYGYLRSDPLGGHDPLGLSFTDLLVAGGIGAAGMLLPSPGDMIQGALSSLVGEYAANQEWDVDWALNWDLGDDAHTRGDSTWVGLALGWGIYDSFGIEVAGYEFNPLDMMASSGGRPGEGPGAALVLLKPIQEHHIASPLSKEAPKFKSLFAQAGMTLEDAANKVKIPHSGRHSPQYHAWVYQNLKNAVGNHTGPAAANILRTELKAMGKFLQGNNGKNAAFLYDTSQRQLTGWRNQRMNVIRGKRGYGLRR